ncbi:Hsp70 family protein [Virgisporangium aurantiacum]|uniref:Hsp70 protein n=1 Tax=Virgisporangium aurantiacum TaxID=175570 RepID=A0A8J4E2D5_9ACTN|nr:Hsp70 family protein [Virgisporangium aurantiacum]GIJ56922.1 hypothetical protein Vau01_044380 [Virgisporangium aurantiacum]
MDHGVVLGIDFGTSNTAAVLRDRHGAAHVLMFDGVPQLPSAVFVADGMRLAGRDALHRALARPAGLEPNPKRRVDEGAVLLGDADEIPVAELIAVVLRRVRDEATFVAGGPPDRVVMTCPAAWGAPRRAVLAAAAGTAGLRLDGAGGAPIFVAEPVAAAAHYARAHRSPLPVGRPVLIVDLGAGTGDATVVRRTADGIDVVATRGMDGVGGLDVDAAVVASLAATLRPDDPAWGRLRSPRTATDLRAHRELWDAVRGAKEHLSRTASTFVYVPLLDVEVPLGREQFDALARPVLMPAVRLAVAVVADAGLAPADLAAVVLAGGSSRLPLVASLLHAALGRAPVVVDQPELAVAHGSLADNVRPSPAHRPEPEPDWPEPPPSGTLPRPDVVRPVSRPPVITRQRLLVLTAVVVVLVLGLWYVTSRGNPTGDLASVDPVATRPSGGGDLAVRFNERGCTVQHRLDERWLVRIAVTIDWRSAAGAPVPDTFTIESVPVVGSVPAREFADRFPLRMAGPSALIQPTLDVQPAWLGQTLFVEITLDPVANITETDENNNRVRISITLPAARPADESRVPCSPIP